MVQTRSTGRVIERDDYVGWKWGNGIAQGKVVDVRPEKTYIQTKGKMITRNGSVEDPAIIIEQANGTKVLKLAHELQKLRST